jgi:hypothetical protein
MKIRINAREYLIHYLMKEELFSVFNKLSEMQLHTSFTFMLNYKLFLGK